MNYYLKYLKYKNKYLELKFGSNEKHPNIDLLDKNLLIDGGDKPFINEDDNINLFIDKEMEKYLNPIYGLIMCETGLIINNYFLFKEKIIETKISKLISKICKKIPGNIQPTNEIMELRPKDFGRFIAIKFINKDNDFLKISVKKKHYIKDELKLDSKNEMNDVCLKKKILNYILKLNSYVPIIDHNEEEYYYLILYCLWWVLNNYLGILEYYQGINEIFEIFDNSIIKLDTGTKILKYHPIDTNIKTNNDFEQIIFKLTNVNFKLYNQESSKNFCSNSKNDKYPDCGETTGRNLINLICFDSTIKKFDTKKLFDSNKSYGPINELVEYYIYFNDFEKQSDVNYKVNIYGDLLNARDAWSKLIINYGFKNLRLKRICENPNPNPNRFELMSGLSLNIETTNFLQLIKNLLGINKWNDLIDLDKSQIIEINDNTINGIGTIYIEHKTLGKFIIYCENGHFYMKMIHDENNESINYKKFNFDEKKIFLLDQILYIYNQKNYDQEENQLPNITLENYLWIKYSPENIFQIHSTRNFDDKIKYRLLELSICDLYDADLRRRLEINLKLKNGHDFFEKFKANIKIQEYTFKSDSLEFVRKIKTIDNINFILLFNANCVDLSPLHHIIKINENFMINSNIKNITMNPLKELKYIENNFLCYSKIKKIDMSNLTNLESIGDLFLGNCFFLQEIILNNLINLKYIGNEFLMNTKIKNIDLSQMEKLENIGNFFISNNYLESINLVNLKNLKNIGSHFLYSCAKIQSIDLYNLNKLKKIESNFLAGSNIRSINFDDSLTDLEYIGNNFASYCVNLESIDLTKISNVKYIGHGFLYGCKNIKYVNLSKMLSLIEIGNYFLNNCHGISTIIIKKSQINLFQYLINIYGNKVIILD